MIWEVLLNFVFGGFNLLLNFFPDADTDTLNAITGNLEPFKEMVGGANWLLPIDFLFYIINFIIAIEGAILVFRVGRWVMNNVTLGIVK